LVPRCGSEGGRPLVVSGRPDIAVLPLGVVGAGHGGTAGEVLAVRVPGEGHPLVAVVPLDEQIPGPVPLAFPVGRDLPALVLEEPVKAAKTGDRLARRHAVERPPVAHRVGAVDGPVLQPQQAAVVTEAGAERVLRADADLLDAGFYGASE